MVSNLGMGVPCRLAVRTTSPSMTSSSKGFPFSTSKRVLGLAFFATPEKNPFISSAVMKYLSSMLVARPTALNSPRISVMTGIVCWDISSVLKNSKQVILVRQAIVERPAFAKFLWYFVCWIFSAIRASDPPASAREMKSFNTALSRVPSSG